jgi:hypothetical protein
MLRQLGIEKGAPFDPDERLRAILQDASAAGELMAQANTLVKRFDGSRYWPDRQWDSPERNGELARGRADRPLADCPQPSPAPASASRCSYSSAATVPPVVSGLSPRCG